MITPATARLVAQALAYVATYRVVLRALANGSLGDDILDAMQDSADATRCDTPLGCLTAFDRSNPRAVSAAITQAAKMVTGVDRLTREALAELIGDVLDGAATPAAAARTIREMVGLTAPQQRAVRALGDELLSAKPGDLISRFPVGPLRSRPGLLVRVPKNLSDSQRLSWAARHRERYARMQRNLRARTIARTETVRAANTGQKELWQQARDRGELPRDSYRVWVATPDDRTRDEHADADGQVVRIDEPFVVADGTSEPGEAVSCRCTHVIATAEDIERFGAKPPPAAQTPPTKGVWPLADDALRTANHSDYAAIRDAQKAYVSSLPGATRASLQRYANNGTYQEINAYKRGVLESIPENQRISASASEVAAWADDVARAIAEAPRLPKPTLVYRGVSKAPGFDPEALLRSGGKVRLDGFQSATTNPATAQYFIEGKEGAAMFEIVTSEGVYLEPFSKIAELVLPHGRSYRVVDKKIVKMHNRFGEEFDQLVYQLEMEAGS